MKYSVKVKIYIYIYIIRLKNHLYLQPGLLYILILENPCDIVITRKALRICVISWWQDNASIIHVLSSTLENSCRMPVISSSQENTCKMPVISSWQENTCWMPVISSSLQAQHPSDNLICYPRLCSPATSVSPHCTVHCSAVYSTTVCTAVQCVRDS